MQTMEQRFWILSPIPPSIDRPEEFEVPDWCKHLKQTLFAIRGHFQENSNFVDDMHMSDDELYHYKSIASSSMAMAQEMAKIIEQGIAENWRYKLF